LQWKKWEMEAGKWLPFLTCYFTRLRCSSVKKFTLLEFSSSSKFDLNAIHKTTIDAGNKVNCKLQIFVSASIHHVCLFTNCVQNG
jgi:hypothetical protein